MWHNGLHRCSTPHRSLVNCIHLANTPTRMPPSRLAHRWRTPSLCVGHCVADHGTPCTCVHDASEGCRLSHTLYSLCIASTARGFKPLRAEPNGFRVHLLSRSDTLSLRCGHGFPFHRIVSYQNEARNSPKSPLGAKGMCYVAVKLGGSMYMLGAQRYWLR